MQFALLIKHESVPSPGQSPLPQGGGLFCTQPCQIEPCRRCDGAGFPDRNGTATQCTAGALPNYKSSVMEQERRTIVFSNDNSFLLWHLKERGGLQHYLDGRSRSYRTSDTQLFWHALDRSPYDRHKSHSYQGKSSKRRAEPGALIGGAYGYHHHSGHCSYCLTARRRRLLRPWTLVLNVRDLCPTLRPVSPRPQPEARLLFLLEQLLRLPFGFATGIHPSGRSS